MSVSTAKKHLSNQFIEPSSSPWASPVVLVSKKDGSLRFCIDYRRLNAITKRDVYPLPRIDDALAALEGNIYFSTFDMCAGYHQCKMHPDSKEKTAFIVDSGLYHWNVMPFGLSNSGATFQRLMDAVFAGLKWKSLLVYIDDVIVFSKSFDSHMKDLEEVFARMSKAQLKFKTNKCFILQSEVKYLGHIVNKNGIRADPDKVKAISHMPVPKNVSELRSFMGMASYYRAFIYNFASVCKSLYELTRLDNRFEWLPMHQTTFDGIKAELVSNKILAHPNYNYPFKIQTDASDAGIGAVLVQEINGVERVIMYLSRSLQAGERKWTVREKEALAIVWAIQMCRVYVAGTKFIVQSDHASLKWLMKATKPDRLVRWALELAEYDFEIIPRRGIHNGNADALSRLPLVDEAIVNSLNILVEASKNVNYEYLTELSVLANKNTIANNVINKETFIRAQVSDYSMIGIRKECEENNGESIDKNYKIQDGLLYEHCIDGRMILLVPHDMVVQVLKSY